MSAKIGILDELRNILTQKDNTDDEVLFKECKQYLLLGKSQNTDFCGQIADASLTMITYTVLSLYKRFQAYETLGALFRDTQKEMLEKTLCERIEMVILKILRDLLEILCIDVEQTLYQLTSSDKVAKEVITLLNAVNLIDEFPENPFAKLHKIMNVNILKESHYVIT